MFLFSGLAMCGMVLFLNTGQEQRTMVPCPEVALVALQTFLKPFLPPPPKDFGAFVSVWKLAFLSAEAWPQGSQCWIEL